MQIIALQWARCPQIAEWLQTLFSHLRHSGKPPPTQSAFFGPGPHRRAAGKFSASQAARFHAHWATCSWRTQSAGLETSPAPSCCMQCCWGAPWTALLRKDGRPPGLARNSHELWIGPIRLFSKNRLASYPPACAKPFSSTYSFRMALMTPKCHLHRNTGNAEGLKCRHRPSCRLL